LPGSRLGRQADRGALRRRQLHGADGDRRGDAERHLKRQGHDPRLSHRPPRRGPAQRTAAPGSRASGPVREEIVSEQNKAVVLKFIRPFSDGDVETAKTCLTPDAVTIAKGFGKLSGPRSYELIVATTGAFKQLIPTGLRPTFHTVTAEDDRVAVEFEGD